MKRILLTVTLLIALATATSLAASSTFTQTATAAIAYLHATGTRSSISIECVRLYDNASTALVESRIDSGDPFYVVVYERRTHDRWRVLDANSTPAGAGIGPIMHLGLSKSTAQAILAGTSPCIN